MTPHTAQETRAHADRSPTIRGPLVDEPVNRKIVLSGLWVAMLFLYAYVDIFAFFRADIINGALTGRVPVTNIAITQQFLVMATLYIVVPTLMVVASLLLPARINRWVNLVVSLVYAASVVSLVIGESWLYYVVGSAFEVALLLGIAILAWTWRRVIPS